jgi:hypothetical protein
MISNIKPDSAGTVSFNGKFAGLRKPDHFVTSAIDSDDPIRVIVQSYTRIGYIDLVDGSVTLSHSFPHGAYLKHLPMAEVIDKLPAEELALLISAIADATNKGQAA